MTEKHNGSVLVVDDVEINLYVMKSMLKPYKVAVDTASSGFDALAKIEAGSTYDIIFMDHMMPKFDGMQTTVKIRTTGYKGAIIALTASVRKGDERFISIGFDGFMSKPVSTKHLEEIMAKYIDGVKAVKASAPPKLNSMMVEAFLRDAQKAILTIRKTVQNGDIRLFTTTVHAMKAALGNICEKESEKLADRLETAGHDGDKIYIDAKAEDFVRRLEELIERFSKQPNQPGGDIEDDTEFLARQMRQIRTACQDYDEASAYKALDILKEREWSAKTAASIDEIHRTLMLRSDFDEAAALAAKFF